jgi:enoyl-CoA hydratase/carnithine racemase
MIIVDYDQNQIATVTLNRPKQLNALNWPLLLQLQKEVLMLKNDPSLRAVIFTGNGKVFCAGADLKERQKMTLEETRQFIRLIGAIFSSIAGMSIPTIAAMQGSAFGGGLELAIACDMRVAQSQAMIGLTECAWGIIPGAGGTQRLTQLVGVAKAKELILSAQKINASEAKAIGLVNHAESSAMEAAKRLALAITKCAPLSVRAAKKAIVLGSFLDYEEGLELEKHCYESILHSQDRIEGLAAFAEKRLPTYSGR